MAKTKKTFFCQNCGSQFSQWHGKCSNCNEWNTIVEEVVVKAAKEKWSGQDKSQINIPQKIEEISLSEDSRIDTGDKELNRVLGGGIVSGSLILLGVDLL